MEHEILPSYVGIVMNHDKDPIEQPVYSIIIWKVGWFFHGS